MPGYGRSKQTMPWFVHLVHPLIARYWQRGAHLRRSCEARSHRGSWAGDYMLFFETSEVRGEYPGSISESECP